MLRVPFPQAIEPGKLVYATVAHKFDASEESSDLTPVASYIARPTETVPWFSRETGCGDSSDAFWPVVPVGA